MYSFILLLYLHTTSNGDKSPNEIELPAHRLYYQTRCTRRYTPGVCAEPVAMVWTYEFQIQNCTERLGCPQSKSTNRFFSYRYCMLRCNMLTEVYGRLLSIDGQNETGIQLADVVGRREGGEINDDEAHSSEDLEGNGDDESLSYAPLMNFADDKEDSIDLEDVLPLDIDNIELDCIPDKDDLFHDAFGRNYKTNIRL